MTILYALILGIIQGLTEFLPISSSGHLMLFENIFGIESSLFFNLLLHVASLMAVIIVLWGRVVKIVKNPFGKEMKMIVIATIPTVILALIVEIFIDNYLLNLFVGFGFLISSILIFVTSFLQRKSINLNSCLTNKKAFVVGLVQGFAVLPGISRSGSTICAGLLQKVDREQSAEFSFILSIPIIIGGMLFEIFKGYKNGFGNVEFLPCFVGFLASFIVALLSIKLMMKIVRKGNWFWFSLYLAFVSVFTLLNQFVFGWF